jgi:competence protein CoiA
MKFALVDGQRQEAQPKRSGVCPACGSPMVAKCGDVRVHHWAHLVGSDCDPWWEHETEWHRAWKDRFPKEWQERVHQAESGERHIADVKTDQGWVLEFQHSNIHPDERKAREAFYQKLIWIVDGARRERDTTQFFKAFHDGEQVDEKWKMRRISLANNSALLRDWAGSPAAVFFDFSTCNEPEDENLPLFDIFGSNKPVAEHLWWLIQVFEEKAYMVPFSKEMLIQCHIPEATKKNLDFAKLSGYLRALVGEIARPHQRRPPSDIERALQLRQQLFGNPPMRRKSRRF